MCFSHLKRNLISRVHPAVAWLTLDLEKSFDKLAIMTFKSHPSRSAFNLIPLLLLVLIFSAKHALAGKNQCWYCIYDSRLNNHLNAQNTANNYCSNYASAGMVIGYPPQHVEPCDYETFNLDQVDPNPKLKDPDTGKSGKLSCTSLNIAVDSLAALASPGDRWRLMSLLSFKDILPSVSSHVVLCPIDAPGYIVLGMKMVTLVRVRRHITH